jgi:biotin carboxyl carrier protein
MIDGQSIVARVEAGRGPHRTVHIAGRRYSLLSTVQGTDRSIDVAGEPMRVTSLQDGTVRAPMPAIVTQMTVRADEQVAAGDPLAVLETMKLETVLSAPFAGRIEELYVRTNDQVDAGGEVLRIQPLEPDRAADPPSVRADLASMVSQPREMDGQEIRLGEVRRLRYLVLGFDGPDHEQTAPSVPVWAGSSAQATSSTKRSCRPNSRSSASSRTSRH